MPKERRPARLDDHHRSRLRAWWRGLNVEERVSALAIEDADAVAIVRHMFVVSRSHGVGLFFGFESEDFDSSDLLYRKFDLIPGSIFMPERTLADDRRLEEAVCLCDTREYLDTLVRQRSAVVFTRAACVCACAMCDVRCAMFVCVFVFACVHIKPEFVVHVQTLSRALLSDDRLFFRVMNRAARGNFLRFACHVSWNAANKCWTWNTPKWFVGMGYW